jgi:hypothetical protein
MDDEYRIGVAIFGKPNIEYNDQFHLDNDEFIEEMIDEANENGDDVIVDDDPARRNLDLSAPSCSYLRYFRYSKGEQQAACRVCGNKISRKNCGTTGMKEHLQRHHKKLFSEYSATKKTPTKKRKLLESEPTAGELTIPKQTMISDFSDLVKWSINSANSKQLDDLVLRYICLSSESLSQTEKPGFSDLLEAACPR